MCGIREVRARRDQKLPGMESYRNREPSAGKIYTPIKWEKNWKIAFLTVRLVYSAAWKGYFEPPFVTFLEQIQKSTRDYLHKESGTEQFSIEKLFLYD